jgi:hypothetical protein
MAAKKKSKKSGSAKKVRKQKANPKKAGKKSGKKSASRRKKMTAPRAASRRAKGRPSRKRAAPERSNVPSAIRRIAKTGGISGDADSQGLSDVERADSESVSELLDEGNTFEAGVVSGVERADEGEKEVRTREFPEDDVPEEYLDND